MKRRSLFAVVACAVACVLCLGLAACKPDSEKAQEAVSELLSSYVVPVADEEGEMPEDPAWPADDFGDAATMEALERYGVDAEEWREHCFKWFGYEVGEVVVADDAATAAVTVTVTNNSLTDCEVAAASDFSAFAQTSDCEAAYESGGRAALFSKLVEYLYARLDAGENQKATTLSVTCVKSEEGDWVPQVSGDVEFFNALYGGSNVVGGIANILGEEAAEGAAE